MSAFTGVNDPSAPSGRNRGASMASDPGTMSRSGSTTSLANMSLNQKFAKFEELKHEFQKDALTPEQRKQKANSAKAAYQKHFNAAQKTWLASHGMPKAVNKAELARLNKESKAYALRLYGLQAARNSGLHAGGKRRSTRRNRKNRRNTRRNRRN
jgi:hypothetical protein